MKKYTKLEGWDDREAMIRDFVIVDEADVTVIRKARAVVGEYVREDYEGSAHVLVLTENGKLLENYGSHCSCFGLEDQWKPNKVSVKYTQKQLHNGHSWMSKHVQPIRTLLSKVALKGRTKHESRPIQPEG